MLKLLKNIFNILNKKQKYSLIGIQLLVVLVGFLEVISITVLGYFVSLIAGIKNFNSNNFFFFITDFFFGKEVNNLFFVSSFLFFFFTFFFNPFDCCKLFVHIICNKTWNSISQKFI